MSNGKGSRQRPMQIPPEEVDQRWAETFGGDLPVYGRSVLDDPDIIAEQLARNREAREKLDQLYRLAASGDQQQDPVARERSWALGQQLPQRFHG